MFGLGNHTNSRRRLGAPAIGLVPLGVVLLLWQVFGTPNSLLFPSPSSWLEALHWLHQRGVLLSAIVLTLQNLVLALAISTALGASLGMAIGSSAFVARALAPLLEFFRNLPSAAIVPLLVLLLGPTFKMSVTVVVIASMWPVLLSTATAVRQIPSVRSEMAQSLRLIGIDRVTKVILPSVAPGILTGVRIATTTSLIVTLLVEMIGTGNGLGRLLIERQAGFDAAGVFGLLILVGSIGYVLSVLTGILEGILLRSHPEISG